MYIFIIAFFIEILCLYLNFIDNFTSITYFVLVVNYHCSDYICWNLDIDCYYDHIYYTHLLFSIDCNRCYNYLSFSNDHTESYCPDISIDIVFNMVIHNDLLYSANFIVNYVSVTMICVILFLLL